MEHKVKFSGKKRLLMLAVIVPCMLFGSSRFSAASPAEIETDDWVLISEQGDIRAYARISECGEERHRVYFMKITNVSETTDYTVRYSVNVVNDPTAVATIKSVQVPAKFSLEASCESRNDNLLIAYVIGGEATDFSHLQFKVLTTKPVSDEK